MSWFRWLRPPSVHERLARYNLRPDVVDAAAAMASDQRSDVYGPNCSPRSLTPRSCCG